MSSEIYVCIIGFIHKTYYEIHFHEEKAPDTRVLADGKVKFGR